MDSITSTHAKKRIKERSAGSTRQGNLALERGVPRTDFTGSFRRYLDMLMHQYKHYSSIYVYANDIYIFSAGTTPVLITLLKVPTHYLKYTKRGGKNG